MAPQGADAFDRKNSIDTCSSEESALVDEELDQAAPSVCSGKSSERLLHEGRRRRGLVALALVVGAMVALCCWSAARGPQLNAAADSRQTSELSEKSGNESDRADAGSHVVDVEESAVVSLAESIPKARLPVVREEAVARSVESSKAKALRGVRSAATEAVTARASEEGEDGKVQSLERLDMPGAAAMEDTKAVSLERSDFPGAGDSKEQSLEQSNMPGVSAAAAAAARARPRPEEPIAVLRPPSKGATSKPKTEAEDKEGPEFSWSALGDHEAAKIFM